MLKALFNSLLSIGKMLIKSRKTNLRTFHTQNKNIIIVGNGPSAQNDLINCVASNPNIHDSTDIMCVNLFASQDIFQKIKPTQYLFLDSTFFEFDLQVLDNPETLPVLRTKPQFLQTQILINQTWKNILAADWKITLHAPVLYKNTPILNKATNQNIEIVYFNYTVVTGFEFFENLTYQWGLGSPQSQNVINSCIFHGINLKYKNIYLIGVENNFFLNFHIDENNQLYIKDDHFYHVQNNLIPVNHPDGRPVTMAQQMSNLHKVFTSHQRLQKYATHCNSNVYNATKNSFIDAYPRKSIPS